MKITIPENVLRKIIADVLIERGNGIMNDADRIAEQELALYGVILEYTAELETTSGGTYCLADDVLSGYISLDEALNEILSSYEKEIVIQKCKEWQKNKEA